MTTWVKVFNSMPGHGKLLLAGDRAGWLFVCGLCYSNEHLTNGFIARHALPAVAPGVKNPDALAQRLVGAELWHEVDGGWRIHDYHEHQRSAEEIRERRAKDSARKSSSRSNGSPTGIHAESASESDRNPCGVRDVDVEIEVEKTKTTTTSSTLRADTKTTDDDRRLCRLFAELAKERNPKFKVKSRGSWLTDMRLLRERDDNSSSDIDKGIRWVFRHHFWGGVIQSPASLREHFPQIWDQMHSNGNVVSMRSKQNASDWLRAINGEAS